MRPANRPGLAAAAGYSLIELLISMALLTVVMGVTLGGLASVMKGNELVMTIASMNNSVRAGLDLMVRDLLQVGSGLPASHAVHIPSGAGSVAVRIPGPPGMPAFTTAAGDLILPAVMPRSGVGPTIDGVATDVMSVLMADNAFLDIKLSAVDDSQVTIIAGVDIGAGPDRVQPGQLMLISKGSNNTLVQVTNVVVASRILKFEDGDSLRLNQSGAAKGTLAALNASDPIDKASTAGVNEAVQATRITRVRMITYYLDNVTEPQHPRLVRRINNGNEWVFDNTLGTAVALDTVDLQFKYDISNGAGNPGGVEMNEADMGTTGACQPAACAETQIRKVSVLLKSRSSNQVSGQTKFLTNTLESQVSLRAMAFVDRYK